MLLDRQLNIDTKCWAALKIFRGVEARAVHLDREVTCDTNHNRKNLEENVLSTSAKARLFAQPAYGLALWGDNVQSNILSASARTNLFALPRI